MLKGGPSGEHHVHECTICMSTKHVRKFSSLKLVIHQPCRKVFLTESGGQKMYDPLVYIMFMKTIISVRRCSSLKLVVHQQLLRVFRIELCSQKT